MAGDQTLLYIVAGGTATVVALLCIIAGLLISGYHKLATWASRFYLQAMQVAYHYNVATGALAQGHDGWYKFVCSTFPLFSTALVLWSQFTRRRARI